MEQSESTAFLSMVSKKVDPDSIGGWMLSGNVESDDYFPAPQNMETWEQVEENGTELTWDAFQVKLMRASSPVRETDANYFAAQNQIARYSGDDWSDEDWDYTIEEMESALRLASRRISELAAESSATTSRAVDKFFDDDE